MAPPANQEKMYKITTAGNLVTSGFEPELVDYVTLIEEVVGLERETAFKKLTPEQLRDAEQRLRTVADHLAEELHIRLNLARQSLPATEGTRSPLGIRVGNGR
jgi:hypothetical protein